MSEIYIDCVYMLLRPVDEVCNISLSQIQPTPLRLLRPGTHSVGSLFFDQIRLWGDENQTSQRITLGNCYDTPGKNK